MHNQPMPQISYWGKYKRLRLYSVERRRKISTAIPTWNILKALVPNIGVESFTNARTGDHYIMSKIFTRSSKSKSRCCNDLVLKSPLLFNILLNDLRDLHGVDVDIFEIKLDHLLSRVPRQEKGMKVPASSCLIQKSLTIKKMNGSLATTDCCVPA